MTPYPVLAEVIATKIQPNFREAWFDFETWERCRNFRDDPNSESKAALDWIRDFYELSVALEDFEDSPHKAQCRDALEAAFEAFARMDHTEELCAAVRQWKDARTADSGDHR